jgi:hypothetical protein
MDLLTILERYQARLLADYGQRLSGPQRQALQAMRDCRTARYGEMRLACAECQWSQSAFHSCGHRSCPRCQHHETSAWLARQQHKLLPAPYFMVTFTLPYELRSLARHHPKTLYGLLFSCAVSTLKDFASNSQALGADIGLTAVLHTHSRRLDYHPHVHIVVPGGCLDKRRKQWKTLHGQYLFNAFALAKVFRARLLAGLSEAGLTLAENLPKQWVVDCQFVGKSLLPLTYLARYLYRGVISEANIIADDGTCVTFRYQDSQSAQFMTRSLKGEDFLWLLLQHVLPKGFRRVRDFGFLHGNAKRFLRLIQWVLRVIAPPAAAIRRPAFKCPNCQQPMVIVQFVRPAWRSG